VAFPHLLHIADIIFLLCISYTRYSPPKGNDSFRDNDMQRIIRLLLVYLPGQAGDQHDCWEVPSCTRISLIDECHKMVLYLTSHHSVMRRQKWGKRKLTHRTVRKMLTWSHTFPQQVAQQ